MRKAARLWPLRARYVQAAKGRQQKRRARRTGKIKGATATDTGGRGSESQKTNTESETRNWRQEGPQRGTPSYVQASGPSICPASLAKLDREDGGPTCARPAVAPCLPAMAASPKLPLDGPSLPRFVGEEKGLQVVGGNARLSLRALPLLRTNAADLISATRQLKSPKGPRGD